jgi:N6-L-threonylcarbamoyladenine synthase
LRQKDIIILGIESSCDDTSAAVLKNSTILSNLIARQEIHELYGGVVPELASRAHQQNIIPVVDAALKKAGVTKEEIDAIAFTKGPGLMGSLVVGTSFSKAFSMAMKIPLLEVNHMMGHVLAHFIDDEEKEKPTFPFLCLTVSGGHTQLMHVEGVGQYTILGETLDDAAGEAFDKTAKLLGLSYPGGPAVSKLAISGDSAAFQFPRPMKHSGDLDFSFAGLKTSVLTQVKKVSTTHNGSLPDSEKANIARGFVDAIVEVLVSKSITALKNTGLNTLVVAGGVGANQQLRESLEKACAKEGFSVHYPPLHLCTDNGAMIAFAGAMRLMKNPQLAKKHWGFDVRPRWPLDQISI